jgi:hypothetical protein
VSKEDEEKIEHYTSSDSVLRISSDFISEYFYRAVFGCLEYNDIESCSLFANLCVLHLYDDNKSLCSIYKSKQSDITLNIK